MNDELGFKSQFAPKCPDEVQASRCQDDPVLPGQRLRLRKAFLQSVRRGGLHPLLPEQAAQFLCLHGPGAVRRYGHRFVRGSGQQGKHFTGQFFG